MDHNVGGALSVSVRKIATIAFLAAVGVLAAFLAAPDGTRGEERVRGVAEVRHAGVGSLPRAPREPDRPKARTMLASYYGRTLEGLPMANGQPFDADAYTAAHKSLPFGTELGVAYGGERVRVTVTDRGPYVAGRDLDLSLAAAREIGLTAPGEAPVRVTTQ